MKNTLLHEVFKTCFFSVLRCTYFAILQKFCILNHNIFVILSKTLLNSWV